MERQLNQAVKPTDLLSNVKRWGGSALASWRIISGGDLEFVATSSPQKKAHRRSGETNYGDGGQDGGRGNADKQQESSRTDVPDKPCEDDDEAGPQALKNEDGAIEKDAFTDTMEVLYGALGADPPVSLSPYHHQTHTLAPRLDKQ
jgi:hypothetical protein